MISSCTTFDSWLFPPFYIVQSVEGVEEEDFVRSNVVEVREMRLFIESHFEPMIHLACVISARHPSGVGADVRALYQRWGIDGE